MRKNLILYLAETALLLGSSFFIGKKIIYEPIVQPSPSPIVAVKPSPTPKSIKSSPSPIPKPIVKNTYKPVSSPSPVPQMANDPDPYVICQSKTGNLQVRKSVCDTSTDCADGHGGYIFTSQEECKKLWDSYSKELTDVTQQMINAWEERDRLYQLQRDLDGQILDQQIEDYKNYQIPDYTTDLQPFVPPVITYPSPSPSPQLRYIPTP